MPDDSPPSSLPPESKHDRHFRTDHLLADLKGRSVRGGAVTITSQGVKFFLNMGSLVVLARLLTPADFGLIAMVVAVTALVQMFKDAGLSMATVQRREINHGQVSTLFWVNVGLGTLLAIVLASLAPVLSWFYQQPELFAVTLVFSLVSIFGGLTVQHQALLKRQMRYTTLAGIAITSLVVSVIVAIPMASLGLGYWALVGQILSRAVTNAVLVWVFSGWIPGPPVRGSGVRSMLAFGGYLTVATFFNTLGSNVDKLLLGRFSTTDALGNYSRAYHMMTLPLTQLSTPLSAVAVPGMSRVVHDPARYRRGYISAMRQFLGLSTPLVLLFIVFAPDLVFVVLGPQWDLAGELIRIFGIAALILPAWNATSWVWISQGRMREHMFFQLYSCLSKIAAVVIGLPWGVVGVAIALTVRAYIMLPVLYWMLGRRGAIRQSHLYGVMAWPFLAALPLAGGLLLLSWAMTNQPSWLRLVASAATAGLIWLVVHAILPHGRALLREYIDSLQQLRSRGQQKASKQVELVQHEQDRMDESAY